jgi:hypothetical protein
VNRVADRRIGNYAGGARGLAGVAPAALAGASVLYWRATVVIQNRRERASTGWLVDQAVKDLGAGIE